MRTITKIVGVGAAVAALGMIGAIAFAQHRHGFGPGRVGMGPGMMDMMRGSGFGPGMMGVGHGTATPTEHGEIRNLFFNHDRIKRTVTNLPDGIRTVTGSNDPECFSAQTLR